ncbi:hypothetical protein RSOL_299280 [Rhizoctonia solani AG-3 Rhs1AP]|uniref:Uncharacterized protein n=1 Tax=Rhizoctonia solani AG-3 Rhs1AP TaxID=1086054 RepID=A0A0A1ULA9_9AGAM|nr:hypothetical protein RSOL_299280 [Rhizoctonia solani AG-3 Rhs1AP]
MKNKTGVVAEPKPTTLPTMRPWPTPIWNARTRRLTMKWVSSSFSRRKRKKRRMRMEDTRFGTNPNPKRVARRKAKVLPKARPLKTTQLFWEESLNGPNLRQLRLSNNKVLHYQLAF